MSPFFNSLFKKILDLETYLGRDLKKDRKGRWQSIDLETRAPEDLLLAQ
jgi:hypothetical protein